MGSHLVQQQALQGQSTSTPADTTLLGDLRHLIELARVQLAQQANSSLTCLYWQIGQRIQNEILTGQRAQYGEEILPTVSAELVPNYGRGFSTRNLWRMLRKSVH